MRSKYNAFDISVILLFSPLAILRLRSVTTNGYLLGILFLLAKANLFFILSVFGVFNNYF